MANSTQSEQRAKTMSFEERVRRRNEFDASLVYGTRKFNLLTRRVEHIDWRQKNDGNWLNSETGLIFDKIAQKRDCPLCGANNYDTIFVKSGFPHVKCKSCEMVYVNPILNNDEYKKLWSKEDSWEDVLESPEQVKMQTLEARYSLDIAKLYLPDGKLNICDVGCGPATLLSEAQRQGHYVFGIEPNTRCHKFLKEKGIDHVGDFFPLKNPPKMQFDCVFFLNTLEHLHHPEQIILEIKKLIKPGGILYISVPHFKALVSRVLHERAGVFAGHSHVQFFTDKTLTQLLEKTGFEVLEYETIITELGVIKNYLNFHDPYFGEGGEPYEFLTPELMYKHHLARNINMVSRLK